MNPSNDREDHPSGAVVGALVTAVSGLQKSRGRMEEAVDSLKLGQKDLKRLLWGVYLAVLGSEFGPSIFSGAKRKVVALIEYLGELLG